MPFTPPKSTSFMISLALLMGATWVDYLTGYEVSVFFLYLFPLAWAAWFLGLSSGLWLSVIATLAHRWADWAGGVQYSKEWIIWERGLSNLVLCVFIVFSFHTFKRGRKTDRARIRQLEELLQVCPGCARINRADGQWKDLTTCLEENRVAQSQRRLCPSCAAARELADYPSL